MADLFKVGVNIFKTTANIFKTTDAALGELCWDANAGGANQIDGSGDWLAANQWRRVAANFTWTPNSYAKFGWGGVGGAVTLTSPTTVRKVILDNFSGTYTLGAAGQTITLYAGILLESTSGACTIISPIILSAPQVWFNRSANRLVAETVNTNGHTVTIDGPGKTKILGAISGAGGIVKRGVGALVLTGVNTYAGTTELHGGVLRLTKSLVSKVVAVSGVLEGPDADGASATAGTITIANNTAAGIRPGGFGNNMLNIGSLAFEGASARMVCDSTADSFSCIKVAGTCALGGMGLIFNAGITSKGTYDLVAADAMSGVLPRIVANDTGKILEISQSKNKLRVKVK